MRIFRKMIGAAICVLVTITTAHAAVISQTMTVNKTTNQFGSFGGLFNQFDPSMGALNSVSLQFSGGITYFVTFNLDALSDCSPFVCYVDFGFSTGYNFNAPGFPLTIPNNAPFFAVVNYSGHAIAPDFSPQNSGLRSIDSGLLFADPSFLFSYIGLGSVDVKGAISEDSDFCEPFFSRCKSMAGLLNLTTTLTYDFTPVPEPITLSMFGIGLAGAIAMRRRKFHASV